MATPNYDGGGLVIGDDEFRRELRRAFREHDQMMAEHRASEEAERVHYKTTETPARHAEPAPVFSEDQSDVIVKLLVRLREERDAAVAPLKAEIAELKAKLDTIAELKGRLDAVLMLLGQGSGVSAKSGEVIELPAWRSRHVG